MNKYVIFEGKPYLLVDGKTYRVRRNEEGLTVGAEVKLPAVPGRTLNEVSISAKFQKGFDSMDAVVPEITEDEAAALSLDENAGEPKETVIVRDGPDLRLREGIGGVDLKEVTPEELEIHAKQHGIDLGSANTESEMVDAIEEAEQAESAPVIASVVASEPVSEEVPLEDRMTLAELKEYAKQHGIDLGSARTKTAIADIIRAVENTHTGA